MSGHASPESTLQPLRNVQLWTLSGLCGGRVLGAGASRAGMLPEDLPAPFHRDTAGLGLITYLPLYFFILENPLY